MNLDVSRCIFQCKYDYRGRVCLHSNLDVSKNSGTPKSSILIGFSIINHPFRDTPIFGSTHLEHSIFTSSLERAKVVDP